MDDPVKAERLAWQNRRQKPWARVHRRADGKRKAARTFAKQGNMRQAIIHLHSALTLDVRALQLEYPAPENGNSSLEGKPEKST